MSTAARFRERSFAASLKRRIGLFGGLAYSAFPRTIVRGLIEAARRRHPMSPILLFPRTIVRGLIEAVTKDLRPQIWAEFPRTIVRGLIEASRRSMVRGW